MTEKLIAVKKMIMGILEGFGYMPVDTEQGYILFCYRMKHFYVTVEDGAEPYISVVYPCFMSVEMSAWKAHMVICNKLNREGKAVKLSMDRDFKAVSASFDFFHTDERTLRENVIHAIEYLEPVRAMYSLMLADLEN